MSLLPSLILEVLLGGIVLVTLVGLGNLAAWLLLGRARQAELCKPIDAFWLGLPVAIAVTQLIHFAAPISTLARSIVCGAAAVGWLLRTAWVRRALHGWRLFDGATVAALAACVVGVISVCHRGPAYDTGLYYEQTILWNQARKIMPGLANLHERLAFNSSGFLLESLFATLLPVGRRYSTVVGTFYWVYVFMAVKNLVSVARGAAGGSWAFVAWSLPFVIAQKRYSRSGNPDIILFVVELAAVYYLLRASEEEERTSRTFHLRLSSLLLVSAVTIKLTGLVFSVCVLAVVWWFWRYREKTHVEDPTAASPPFHPPRPAIAGLCLSLLIAGGWVARNILLSGELLFPVPMTTVPVRWALPKDVAFEGQFRDIRAWARAPGVDFLERAGSGHWFKAWLERALSNRQALVTVLCLALSAPALLILPRGDPPRQVLVFLWLTAVAVGAFVFSTAPDFRFAGAALVVGNAPLAVVLLDGPSGGRPWRVAALLVCSVLSGYLLLTGSRSAAAWIVSRAQRPEYPVARVSQVHLDGGLTVNVPVASDQCWDAGLPCAPFVSARLGVAGPAESLGSILYFYMRDRQGLPQ